MKKALKSYLIIWSIGIVLFNGLVFWVGIMVSNINNFTSSFWISYAFIMLAFVGNLACSVYFFKLNNLDKAFLNVPIISIAYSGLISSIIFGTIIMAIPVIPNQIAAIVVIAIFVFYVVAVVKAKTAADIVSDIDKTVKTQTLFIKSLTIDAQSLVSRATTSETKAAATKVYEAVRYSDPMSNESLAGAESQITIKFNEFSNAVFSNANNAIALANECVILINDRNNKCRLLK